MADLSQQIEDAAGQPRSATVDGVSATSHSLPDLIEADKYLAGKTAATKNHLGIRSVKLEPGGCG